MHWDSVGEKKKPLWEFIWDTAWGFSTKQAQEWWLWAGMRAKKDQQEIEDAILQGKAESMSYLSDLKQDQVLFK